MSPRQIALLKEAVRHDGFIEQGYIEDIEALKELGYVEDIGFYVCQITAKGTEALRNAREW
jgi:hypothetical protein